MERSSSLGSTVQIIYFDMSSTSARVFPLFFKVYKEQLAVALPSSPQAIARFICIVGSILDKG